MSQLQQDIAEFGSLNVLRTLAPSELEAISRYGTLLNHISAHYCRRKSFISAPFFIHLKHFLSMPGIFTNFNSRETHFNVQKHNRHLKVLYQNPPFSHSMSLKAPLSSRTIPSQNWTRTAICKILHLKSLRSSVKSRC